MMWVPVKKLSQICNPLLVPPWGGVSKPISFQEISNALKKIYKPSTEYEAWKGEPRIHHINRVAWYVVNGWGDSNISIDFSDEWIIWDGNHRTAAAIYRGDDMIWADVYGAKEKISSLY